MRAWKGIKELPPESDLSFFKLGGFHGEPFRGAGWGSSAYWGGYCNHGNVLFPTWHRVYLLKLEEALQSIKGCEDVMLPYWDETSEEALKGGVPWALTAENFELDGATIPNPLRSFKFPKQISDFISADKNLYTKPEGYETVRYPLSGLVGNDDDKKATDAHNALYPHYDKNVELLNQNLVNWLNGSVSVDGKVVSSNGVAQQFKDCLEAPNYTVFSNTSSAAQWNSDRAGTGERPVTALESPHNHIHLAVGGFDVPQQGDFSPIEGANGDMGENNTAGLDPIFYFHHCNVDRVFWLWQKKHGFTDSFEVLAEYPGTNTVDNQGPTPGVAPNTWLTLESPLAPFKKMEDGKERYYTSRDCINIETQLGITYSRGSLEEHIGLEREAVREGHSTQVVHVSGINRATIRGSFLISVFATINGKRYHIGTEGVLSRWNVQGCANCQTHLEAQAFFGLHGHKATSLENADFEVEVRGRDGLIASSHKTTLANKQKRLSLKVHGRGL
jgi:tyrosinase